MEAKAFFWFLKKGFKEDEINFNSHRVVDLVVRGRPYEVKKLIGRRALCFTKNQLETFKEINPTILVFDNKHNDPVAVVPFNAIQHEFKIEITGKTKSVGIPEEIYALAEKLVRLGLEENMGKAFANAIKEYVKKREELIKGIQAVKQKWSKDEFRKCLERGGENAG